MGTGTLEKTPRGTTEVAHLNAFRSAMNEDFVPRNALGAPSGNTENAGSPLYPYGSIVGKTLYLNGNLFELEQQADKRNRVISGAVRSTSNQPAYLDPAGTSGGRTVTVLATATDLVFNVDGTAYTLDADLAIGSLTAAPGSQNTATVNDSSLSDTASSRVVGEYFGPQTLTIASAGTNITAKVGTYQAFKLSTEIFLAFVESTTTLVNCYRGFFVNSSLAPVNRETVANTDTITLLSLAWIFLETDLTATVTYNNPTWAYDEPTSPSSGDFWYDMANQTWKIYSAGSFIDANATFIGWAVCDTADCIGARCVDYFKLIRSINTFELEKISNSVVRAKHQHNRASVNGADLRFGFTLPTWDMASHLADSSEMYTATEQASRMYYFYLTDQGERVISDIEPYYRPDLGGMIHPHNTWLCLGYGRNDGSSNLAEVGWYGADDLKQEVDALLTANRNSATWSGTSAPVAAYAEQTRHGSAIRLSASTDFQFNKRAYYDIHAYMQIEKTAATSAVYTMGFYNSTRSAYVGTVKNYESEVRSGLRQTIHYRDRFRIDYPEDTYQLLFTSTAANYSGFYSQILIHRPFRKAL